MKIIYILFVIFISMILISCSSSNQVSSDFLITEKYSSVFPNREVSNALGDIIKSIKKINNITFYKRYDFDKGIVTANNLDDKNLEDKAIQISRISRTSSGTAAIISVSGSKVALLTAAHIVSYPDTVIGYFTQNGIKTKFIESIAIKIKQQIYGDLPDGGGLEVIVKDDDSDIAIVGNSFPHNNPINTPVLKFKFGSAKELNWGSFIYIFGFPMGNQMVTRGIVSSPNKDGKGRFLVDAVLNKGSSGGLVFAIRGESPNFELVGMVSAVPASKETVLSPYTPDLIKNFVPGSEYEGKMAIKRIVEIKYGIGKIIPVERLKEFFEINKSQLIKQGFDLSFL